VLLELLKRLSQETDYAFDVVFRRGGPLLEEFEKISTCYVWHKQNALTSVIKELIFSQKGSKLKSNAYRKKLLKSVKQGKYALVYVNSVQATDVLMELTESINIPVILHVHELEVMIKSVTDPLMFANSLKKTSAVIAVSEMVKQNLIQQHHISQDKVQLVHEFIPDEVNIFKSKADIRNELGIEPNAFVVISSGTIDLRKGIDLFVQVAKQVNETEKAHFIWLGANTNSYEYYLIQQDIRKLKIEDKIKIIESVTNPYDYYAAADLFLMTSREDPFPLVCLEAGKLGKPIVCFDEAIGSTEFIDDITGKVVPYLDVDTMTKAVLNFKNDSSLLKNAGIEIIQRVKKYNAANATNKIIEIIDSVIN
jgi:glycosyltransferase involved in cell wall biosynthesis